MKTNKYNKQKLIVVIGLALVVVLCTVLGCKKNNSSDHDSIETNSSVVTDTAKDTKIESTDEITQESATQNNSTQDLNDELKDQEQTSSVQDDNTLTLLNTYGDLFYVGNCVSLEQLKNPDILNHIKKEYNSITLENEMKPDALLGSSPSLMLLDKAKEEGIFIPKGYEETFIPKINFDTIDQVLKICYENKLSVRAHTLLWHNQTPYWFYREGYNTANDVVDKKKMDLRLEYYIKNVMNHVYDSEYGSIVYAWDVVNEYLHAGDRSGWQTIYGLPNVKSDLLKYAFELAYDCLKEHHIADKVSLFYNDYNTFEEVEEIKALIEYINSDEKICSGVGMQSHVATDYPTVENYTKALQAFVDAGLEVQITEVDIKSTDEIEQANYVYDLFSEIIRIKNTGGNITGLTFWGLYDEISWIRQNNPLLFTSFDEKKESYHKAIQAYVDNK